MPSPEHPQVPGNIAQLAQCLPSTHKTLGSIKPGVVVHTCDLGTWAVETGEYEVQGHLLLHEESETPLC